MSQSYRVNFELLDGDVMDLAEFTEHPAKGFLGDARVHLSNTIEVVSIFDGNSVTKHGSWRT
jgi:hypothetical protein